MAGDDHDGSAAPAPHAHHLAARPAEYVLFDLDGTLLDTGPSLDSPSHSSNSFDCGSTHYLGLGGSGVDFLYCWNVELYRKAVSEIF
jgi:hypothetical protein